MLEDLRDIIIVIYGILGIVTLIVTLIVVVVIGVAVRRLVGTANNAIQGLTPIIEDARETASRVRGTVNFVSETTVSPIIRIYSIVMGIRQGLAVFTGLKRWTGRR